MPAPPKNSQKRPAVTAPVLRPYQSQAVEAIRAQMRGGSRSVLLVSPTGSGKTILAAELIRAALAKGSRIVFLAHRRELLNQTSAKLDSVQVPHGIISASHDRNLPHLPVQVASVSTLVRRPGHYQPADLLVIDESHHFTLTNSYQKVLAGHPAALVVGLTATPFRLDGRGLGDLFTSLVVAAQPSELLAQGHLVPLTGFAYDAPDLSGVHTRAGDYDQRGLELVMGGRKLCGSIVEQWKAHARGERTVVFAVNVQHSQTIVERFRAAGVAAEHIDGSMATEQRDAILDRLSRGETRVLSNCALLLEGWDVPTLECLVFARPTKSLGLFLQACGRVLRPACLGCGASCSPAWPTCPACGSTKIKRSARLHDHAGAVLEHGLPLMDRAYTLAGDRDVRARTAAPPPLRTCKSCFAIYDSSAARCPLCGAVSAPTRREIEEIEGDHVEAIALERLVQRSKAPESARRDAYDRLRARCAERGYRPGWAKIQYKIRFGAWPPAAWVSERVHA